MYYVMSIPEILVLLFIVFLWVLSIICCFKRYEKISTIERADMPNFNKQIIINESIDTASSISSKNNTTNSTNNLNTSFNCQSSINNLNLIDDNFENENLIVHTTSFNNKIITTPSFDEETGFMYEKLPESVPSSAQSKNMFILNESASLVPYRFSNEKYKYQRYKKNNNFLQYAQATPNTHQHHLHTHFSKNPQIVNQTRLSSSSHLRPFIDAGVKKGSRQRVLLKSSSEPAFKELINEMYKLKKFTFSEKEPLLRASSIDEQKCTISVNNSNLSYNSSPSKNTQKYSEMKTKRKRAVLNYNNKSFNDNNLLDPHLIPKCIQKSLIDLHKRSVWNLSHKPVQKTAILNTMKPSKIIIVEDTGSGLSGSNATVFTQQKHRSEIKMKIIDNFV